MKVEETYQERYNRAKARVEEIRSFYNHLLIYITVNIGLASLNYYDNEWDVIWFIYPFLGWGIGVVGHALSTFNANPFTGKDWERRKVQEILEKED